MWKTIFNGEYGIGKEGVKHKLIWSPSLLRKAFRNIYDALLTWMWAKFKFGFENIQNIFFWCCLKKKRVLDIWSTSLTFKKAEEKIQPMVTLFLLLYACLRFFWFGQSSAEAWNMSLNIVAWNSTILNTETAHSIWKRNWFSLSTYNLPVHLEV